MQALFPGLCSSGFGYLQYAKMERDVASNQKLEWGRSANTMQHNNYCDGDVKFLLLLYFTCFYVQTRGLTDCSSLCTSMQYVTRQLHITCKLYMQVYFLPNLLVGCIPVYTYIYCQPHYLPTSGQGTMHLVSCPNYFSPSRREKLWSGNETTMHLCTLW